MLSRRSLFESPRPPSDPWHTVAKHAADRAPQAAGRSIASAAPNASGKRICFVSHNVYAVLAETSESLVGGAEVQQAIIARCLQQNHQRVSFVTNVFGDRHDDEVIDDFQVYKSFAPGDGAPFLRFFHPRLSGLWQALKRADADVYYQRCADKVTAVCALFCRRYGRKFVFSGAHDTDFDSCVKLNLHQRMLYQWGLRRADIVLVQSEQQKRLLAQNYSRNGTVLPNVYPARPLTKAEGYVLWVGTMRDFKRPLLCLDVARRFPHVPFIMIGGPGSQGSGLYERVRSQQPPNLTVLGFQPLEVTEKYFDGASLLLNTSTVEGFPNTYLQAWSRGIPVVGTFDPDQLNATHALGRTFSDLSDLGEWFDSVRTVDWDYRSRIQQFFEGNFAPQRYVDGLLTLLDRAPL